jgi:hypothetical membrane protein
MNAAFILLGALMILGSLAIYQEFTERTRWQVWTARVGFASQGLAGLGSIIVGLVPEDTNQLGHRIGAGAAIAVGTLGVLLLGLALPLSGRLRRFMLWCSPVSLVAILLFALHELLGFGPGGMERIAAYPEVIWLISFGFYISCSHYAQGSAHRPAGRLRLAPRGWLPVGRAAQPYSTAVGSLGGADAEDRQFELRKSTRLGLTLSTAGVLSGTPTGWGIFRVPIQLTDGTDTVSKTFTLLVRP